MLFRTEMTDAALAVPRIDEVVVIDEQPYQVVDVEYWARRVDRTSDRRFTCPTVYVVPIHAQAWQIRLERRQLKKKFSKGPPQRY